MYSLKRQWRSVLAFTCSLNYWIFNFCPKTTWVWIHVSEFRNEYQHHETRPGSRHQSCCVHGQVQDYVQIRYCLLNTSNWEAKICVLCDIILPVTPINYPPWIENLSFESVFQKIPEVTHHSPLMRNSLVLPGAIALVNSGSDWSAVNVFVVTLTSSSTIPLFSPSTTKELFKLLWVLCFSSFMSEECSFSTSLGLVYSRKFSFLKQKT